MKIAVACDHGGLELKNAISKFITDLGHEVEDFGTYTNDSVDYPDYASKAALAVASGQVERGIVVCGTGIGVSIVANKIKGIRCALAHDTFSARATREHNDTNMLALGQRVIGEGLALDIVKLWLETEFAGERHMQRIEKMMSYEGE
ncbi:ribose 5-phosphate isomerase B [Tannockella kyphosi]|uniref:ribose 5-phosphate isomerase B n=1 Tax=Tannockella kyphosi TaxID=2899121 RepID=UPI002011BA98|nr:ribose 5-phosphate isomerase B [Tannockella kyphosi]